MARGGVFKMRILLKQPSGIPVDELTDNHTICAVIKWENEEKVCYKLKLIGESYFWCREIATEGYLGGGKTIKEAVETLYKDVFIDKVLDLQAFNRPEEYIDWLKQNYYRG